MVMPSASGLNPRMGLWTSLHFIPRLTTLNKSALYELRYLDIYTKRSSLHFLTAVADLERYI